MSDKAKLANSKGQRENSDEKYEPSKIESHWQQVWEQEKIYQPDLDTANPSQKFYNLNMFPYPSAEGLHVGNMYAFTGGDIYGRFKRMQGNTVFQPMGLDGFGIHSENYALKVGSHPMAQADKSEKNFYRQLRTIGNGYDWSRTVETWKPDYYRWTQWVFIELFKAGLAYRAASNVNWCPSCKTVLADEQVIDGLCERCSSQVEKREMEQWFFRITSYSERLLTDLEKIDWTEKVKIAQKNWIGKSEGAKVSFKVVLDSAKASLEQYSSSEVEKSLEVFTTRPDTLHGATFMVVSPEHPLVAELLSSKLKVQSEKLLGEVRSYVEQAAKQSDKDRRDESKEKTGVFSGIYAINPVNDQQIPIWIADYVLMGYGTGAIMAVPAHDQRDFEFAKKYDLPIIDVVIPSLVDKGNPPQKGKEDTTRTVVLSVVYDPKTDTYLTLHWKQRDWRSFITGGVEVGENLIEAAKREIREETGYTDVKFTRQLGGPIEAFFYAAHKDVNRQVQTHLMFFELVSDARDAVSDVEKEYYDIDWMTKDAIQKASFRHAEMDMIWNRMDGEAAYTGEGVLINSGEWDGWKTPQAKQQAIAWLAKKEVGQKNTNYHLRDWLISRQRYWGAPIPMIFCQKCADEGKSWFTSPEYSEYSESQRFRESDKSESLKHRQTESSEFSGVAGWYPEENLPVLLPNIEDYRPVGTGKAPLANHPEFYETTCPACGGEARRETDVADTFLDSGWYFLRYPGTDFSTLPFPMPNPEYSEYSENQNVSKSDESESLKHRKTEYSEFSKAKKRFIWFPVDQYTGGAEHSVLHLLYSRFVYKVFCDLGYISPEGGDEPFPKFFAHGLIIKDGAKMSKSKGNVVVPDLYIQKYGADTLRTYLMFLGPFSEGGDFQDAGIDGINRYLKRVWKLLSKSTSGSSMDQSAKALMHRTIKGVTQDLGSMRYNTAIAKLMTWYNSLSTREAITDEEAVTYLKLLAPFAPHMTEELYQRYSEEHRAKSIEQFESIHVSAWPEFDEAAMVEETATIAIQVNGKLRETIRVASREMKNEKLISQMAMESDKIKRFIDGHEIKKTIFIPGKILNIVI